MARRGAAAGVLLALGCSATGPRWEEDGLALVQSSLKAQAGASRFGNAERLLNKPAKAFNCTEHPLLCQPPFNCQAAHPDMLKWTLDGGWAASGHSNLETWCLFSDEDFYVHECLAKKDLVNAAKLQFQWAKGKGTGMDELDASYCFIEGHCTNEAVTNETTLQEADHLCDLRYGNDWHKFGSLDRMGDFFYTPRHMPKDPFGGFHDTRVTKSYAMAACAMGNFHCDVVYCKENYCKDDYYRKKYEHLQPRAPGHLLQFIDYLP